MDKELLLAFCRVMVKHLSHEEIILLCTTMLNAEMQLKYGKGDYDEQRNFIPWKTE